MSTNTTELFQIGGPVSGAQFYGRKDVLDQLRTGLVDKNTKGYALYGPRRIGKTSVLREFVSRQDKMKCTPIYIDVASIHPFSIERFYDAVFLASIKSFKPKMDALERVQQALSGSLEALSSILKNTEVTVSIKDYLDVKMRLMEKKADLSELLQKSFGHVEEMSGQTGSRGILILDEFQLIEQLQEGTLWAIRSAVQNWKSAGLLVSGSEISMVEQMVAAKTAPFYMLLRVIELGPFDEKTSIQMMDAKFNKAGIRHDTGSLKRIHERTAGYPFYLQWLGDKTHDLQPKQIDVGVVEKAFGLMLKEGDVIFRADVERLSDGEREVLIELAKGEKNITAISKKIGTPAASVAKFMQRLIEKSYAKRRMGADYAPTDAVLSEWIKQKYDTA